MAVLVVDPLLRLVDFPGGRSGWVRPRRTKQQRNTQRRVEHGDAEHGTQGARRRGIEFELPPQLMRIFPIAECKRKEPTPWRR